MYDEWTCAGNTLSRVSPLSLATIKIIKVELDTYALVYGGPPQYQLPAMGGLIEEIASMSGGNAVEEIFFGIYVSHETFCPLDDAKYRELDTLLSLGFPKLRKLHIALTQGFFDWPDDPFEGAVDFEKECRALFQDHFGWCRRNLDFSVEIEGYVA
jgi:hypothetical protein